MVQFHCVMVRSIWQGGYRLSEDPHRYYLILYNFTVLWWDRYGKGVIGYLKIHIDITWYYTWFYYTHLRTCSNDQVQCTTISVSLTYRDALGVEGHPKNLNKPFVLYLIPL
jgi:hypothetical protein